MMNVDSESVGCVMDFWVKFLCGFLGRSVPSKGGQNDIIEVPEQNPQQDPCKIRSRSEKKGVAKSILQRLSAWSPTSGEECLALPGVFSSWSAILLRE